MKLKTRISAMAMSVVMAFSFIPAVFAANSTTAAIDTGRGTSLTLYKYDLTAAQDAGAWDTASYVSSGLLDEEVNTALSPYAIQGVEFSYLKVADLAILKENENGQHRVKPLYGFTENTKTGSRETVEFLSALGLTTNDAYTVKHDEQENRVWYFESDVLIDALSGALAANATATKEALESYMASNGGTAMPETSESGKSAVSGLAQGLYLLVETRVPENAVDTTDPFLVSLPMTTVDGNEWNYDLTLYPKNSTGNPTLEKTVRESKADTGRNGGNANDITDGYAHTATASDGDTVEYQIISTLPTITSPATALSTYTHDTLKDCCHVYTYGIDLTKQFSDNAGNFDKVKFLLKNNTDGYFVQAKLDKPSGAYYVTGHTDKEDDATTFTPVSSGKITVKGLEDDSYSIAETATDSGYTLLKETVSVEIASTEGQITCDLCGAALRTATAKVNGKAVAMQEDNSSVNAIVPLTVTNTRNFTLPKTGGSGTRNLYLFGGFAVIAGMALAVFVLRKKRHA